MEQRSSLAEVAPDNAGTEVERLEGALGKLSFTACSNTQAKLQLLEQLIDLFKAASWGDATLAQHAGRMKLLRVLRELLLDDVSSVRAAVLRALRYLHISDDVVKKAISLRLPQLVAMRLEANTGDRVWERVCALKLLIQWLAAAADGRSEVEVPRIFVIALVSVAEHQNDELQSAALRALCDAALVLPRLVADCNGIAVLAEALVDPTQEALAPSLVATLVHTFDELSTHADVSQLRSMCIRGLFAVYTGAASEPAPTCQEAKAKLAKEWSAARRAILLLLRSATGLFALSSEPHGLHGLCQLLRHSIDPALKCALLDLFADIVSELCVAPLPARAAARRHFSVPVSSAPSFPKMQHPSRYTSFGTLPIVGRSAAVSATGIECAGCIGKHQGTASQSVDLADDRRRTSSRIPDGHRFGIHATLFYPSQSIDVLEVYAGLVLKTLLSCGLAEALGTMCLNEAAESTCPEAVQAGAKLLSDMNNSAAVLLPASACTCLQQSLCSIVSAAGYFGDMRQRSLAEDILTRLTRGSADFDCGLDLGLGEPYRWIASECMSMLSQVKEPSTPKRAQSARGRLTAETEASPSRIIRLSPRPNHRHKTTQFLLRPEFINDQQSVFSDVLKFAQATGGEGSHRKLLDDLNLLMSGPVQSGSARTVVDDLHAMLKQTGVIGFSKDFSKWDWRLVHELVFGPLCHPSHLQEALNTKFFKRLLRFFSPRRNSSFGNLDWKPDNLQFARLGLFILGLLLVHPGARQQHLAAPDSIFNSNSFPADLAGMLTRELSAGQNGSSPGSSCSVAAPVRYRSSTKPWRRHGLSMPVVVGESPRLRSNSDPPDCIGRSRTDGQSNSPPLGPRNYHSIAPGAMFDGERPASWDSHESVLGDLDTFNDANDIQQSHRSSDMSLESLSSGFMGILSWSSRYRPLASKDQSRRTLAREYAAYLGLMASSAEGITILKNSGVYQTLHALCELPSKEYLLSIVLPQLHFGFEPNRQLLEVAAFQSGNSYLQLCAVQLLALSLDASFDIPGAHAGFMIDTGVGVVPSRGRSLHSQLLDGRRIMPRPESQLSLVSMVSSMSAQQPDRSRCNSTEEGSSVLLTDAVHVPNDAIDSDMVLAMNPAGTFSSTTAAPLLAFVEESVTMPPPCLSTDYGSQVSAPFVKSEAAQIIEDPPKDFERWPWIVEQLAKAVMQGDHRAARMAEETLQERCCNEEAANVLLMSWPSELSMQERWSPGLRMLLLQTEKGFQQMQQSGCLEKDFNQWLSEDYYVYVDVMSTLLGLAMSPPSPAPKLSQAPLSSRRSHSRGRSGDRASTFLRSSGAGERLPVPNSNRFEDDSTSRVWLCSVPWRPSLHIQRAQHHVEEILLDVVVERAVPHEFHRRMENRRSQRRLGIQAARSELRISAVGGVCITGEVILTAHLAIGSVKLEDATSVFEGDWSLTCLVEELPDDGGSVYEFQRVPNGAVWTFLDDHHARLRSQWRDGKPSCGCRLISISWPLELLEKERAGLVPPPQFCTFLVSTLQGAEYLRQTSLINRLIRSLVDATSKQGSSTREARAALWTAGHLGRTHLGFELLLEATLLPPIVALATRASRSSLRLTAIYCLAMIGSNPLAAEPLGELGWDVSLRGAKNGEDIVLDHTLTSCLGVSSVMEEVVIADTEVDTREATEGQQEVNSYMIDAQLSNASDLPYARFDSAHLEVLEQLEALHNTVVRKKTCDTLRAMRQKEFSTFQSVRLWCCAQRCVEGRYHQPLPVRRFIAELFSETLKSHEALELLDTLPV